MFNWIKNLWFKIRQEIAYRKKLKKLQDEDPYDYR
jgi:hypothetical protein